MKEWCDARGVEIWYYSPDAIVMPNHVHLIAVPETKKSLTLAIGEAHRRYSRMINFRWKGLQQKCEVDCKNMREPVGWPGISNLLKNWKNRWV